MIADGWVCLKRFAQDIVIFMMDTWNNASPYDLKNNLTARPVWLSKRKTKAERTGRE
jgi:hypothetical protein